MKESKFHSKVIVTLNYNKVPLNCRLILSKMR